MTSKPVTREGAGIGAAASREAACSANACASPPDRQTSITRAPEASMPVIRLSRPAGDGDSSLSRPSVRLKPS